MVALKGPQPVCSCPRGYRPARTGICNLHAYTVEVSANTAVTSRPPIACSTAYVSVWACAVKRGVSRP